MAPALTDSLGDVFANRRAELRWVCPQAPNMTADERIVRTYRRECRDQEHFDGIEPVLVNHLHVDYTDRVQLEQALLTAPDNQPHISIRWRDGERDRETVHFDRIDRVVVAPGHVGIEQLRLSAEAGE